MPTRPVEACQALAAVGDLVADLLDPESRRSTPGSKRPPRPRLPPPARGPPRAGPRRSWFYLAGAYAPLVQWRVLRGERLAAAREGKRIKEALERALALDPTLQDAYFGIGLYHYYADVAPAALKIAALAAAAAGGRSRAGPARDVAGARPRRAPPERSRLPAALVVSLVRAEAGGALALLRGLDARYPSNPIFLQRIAEVQHEYFHDHRGARRRGRRCWRARARAGRRRTPRRSARETRTRRGAQRNVPTRSRHRAV